MSKRLHSGPARSGLQIYNFSIAIAAGTSEGQNATLFRCVTHVSLMSSRWLLVIALGLGASPALAGAFAQPQGMLLVIRESSVTGASQAFDAGARLTPAPAFRKYAFDTVLEYGALDWLTVLGRIETLGVYTQGPPAALYRGLGMSELGARIELGRALEEDLVFSAQTVLRLPGARTDNPAAVGMTQRQADWRLMMGGSFALNELPGFWSLEAGQRKRGAPDADEWRLEAMTGLFIFDRLQGLAQVENVFTRKAPLAPQSRSHKAQFSLVLNPGRPWSLQAGIFRTIAGVNARQEKGLLIAWWRRM